MCLPCVRLFSLLPTTSEHLLIQAYQPSVTPYKFVSNKNGKIGKLVLHLYIPRQENHHSFKGRGDLDFILSYM